METPTLTADPAGLAARVAARVPALRRYRPPAGLWGWAAGPHAQTLLGVLRAAAVRGVYGRRQLLDLPDGGTAALDWWQGEGGGSIDRPAQPPPTAPLFLVLHGLTGGSSEGYVKVREGESVCLCVWMDEMTSVRGALRP